MTALAVDLPSATALQAAERDVPERLHAPQLHAQAGEVIEEPHNCRPSCIWGDAVCRALLGERWSDTRERCNNDGAPDVLDIPELQGDGGTPYVSSPAH